MCGCARVAFPLALSALSAFQLISIIPSPSHSCNSFAIIYILTPDLLSLSDRCGWCPCLRSCVARWCSCFMFLPHVPVCSVFHRSRNHLAHFFNRTTHHVICTDHLVPVLPVSVCVFWNIHLYVYHIKPEFLASCFHHPLSWQRVLRVWVIKGIVHPKMKIWCLSAYPQGIQDVGDFVYSVEHKRRFLTQTVAVCQSYNGSQWDPRLWESKKHTQTKPN